MDTNNSLLRRASLTSLAVLLVAFLVSCSFTGFPHPPEFCDNFEELPLTELSQRPSDTAIYDPIRDDQIFMKAEQSLDISEYANKGQGAGFNVCQGELEGVKTEDFAIEKVPFDCAISLTGWRLKYPCDDGDVKEIGIWVVDEWRYDKRPATPAGTLRYKPSSILRDKDGDPGPLRSHKVTILGLRPTVSVAEKQTAPDLVPFSPYGNYRSAFCRVEQGRKLRVTVKNQGNDKAPASKTMVTFGDKSFSLDTPAIPVGGSVDLLLDVPASCLRPFCSFKIMVDANSRVDELNMEGNNSASGGCIG